MPVATSRPTSLRLALVSAWLLGGIACLAPPLAAQDPSRGADARVDYASLTRLGPWDDRNYRLTTEDLSLLAPNEHEMSDPIPAFFRVEMRRAWPELRRSGPAQYPRSALQVFRLLHTGYLVQGKFYKAVERRDGRFVVKTELEPIARLEDDGAVKFLSGERRVTSPNGAAESAIKINPVDTNRVIAGTNGPGSGQKMFYSTDGGDSWSPAAALPLGNTCCDPTVDWNSAGTIAHTATLGGCGSNACNIWYYRSNDGGQTWNGLEALTPGDSRRELTSGGQSDKEYLHVDKSPTSPHQDNVYLTWHDNNVMKFARSTDDGNTWSTPLSFSSDPSGIGSDITTDKAGNVYYFWPDFDGREIVVKKSTNGGASFAAGVTTVASTNAAYDFPLPSMDTRRTFVYVAADADLTDGPYAGSLYAAWTDSTAATGNDASNNHGRIQVGFSRNGGATWTVVTPHETADQTTVDRYHPWLAVGGDGTVHVAYYDTRRDASRTSVDLFYTSSTDGGQSFAAPTRLTAQQSPKIDDSFEFGDYNGLDVVMNDVIAIFTDNRNEGGGGADSVDVYAAGLTGGGGGGGGAGSGEPLSEDFEGDVSDWTTGGLWHAVTDSACAPPGYSSASTAMYYGQDGSCNYDTGSQTAGNLVSPEISCVTAMSTLTFQYFRQVEETLNDAYETVSVAASIVGQAGWTTLWSRTSLQTSETAWTSSGSIALGAFAGQTIQLRFRFDSVDEIENGFVGWLVDDVVTTGACEGADPDSIFQDDFESGGIGAWS